MEMIVWGGFNTNASELGDGGRYNPIGVPNWTLIGSTLPNAPAKRYWHSAVWTGSEMIVWGGRGNNSYLNTGGRYNPTGNSWTTTSTGGVPLGRTLHTAVWTGSCLIVWGGSGLDPFLNDGGCYSPAENAWTGLSLTNAPTIRRLHAAVWTGSEMIVVGGYDGTFLNDTWSYTPGRTMYLYQRP
jgi:N-acetylneuraminic acid mutarotase